MIESSALCPPQARLRRYGRRRRERLAWGRRTYVMGVINVTPDSFSGDGMAGNIPGIVDLALRFQDHGADILDIGAESTRPGHAPVPEDEELARLLPALGSDCVPCVVAHQRRYPQAAGGLASFGGRRRIINDVWGLKQGPELAVVAAQAGRAGVDAQPARLPVRLPDGRHPEQP